MSFFPLCSLSELLQSVKTSVTPPNNELSDNESLKHPLNLALTCSTSWRDICVCVALCHGNKKKSSDIVTPRPPPNLSSSGRAGGHLQSNAFHPHLLGRVFRRLRLDVKAIKKSHYFLSQDSGEEGRGSRHEKDLFQGSSEMGFKGWRWHLQNEDADIKCSASLHQYRANSFFSKLEYWAGKSSEIASCPSRDSTILYFT